MVVTQRDISNAADLLELSGGIVCLHSSLRSFGRVEGGADTVVAGLLNKGITIIVPTFYYGAIVCPPPEKRIIQNGTDYSSLPAPGEVVSYRPLPQMIDKSMGAVPACVLKMKECERGDHPINSLSAVGPKAKEIIECQKPLDVYAPFRKLYGREDAFIVLAGVDLRRATAIHFAEQLAGRRLFRAWAEITGGLILETEVGSCSEGFNKLKAFTDPIERSIHVGESLWRVFPFRKFIDAVTEAIKSNQSITHCEDDNCLRCNDAVSGGPVV
jgi:aminoglycoside N3'-acetyltransferase